MAGGDAAVSLETMDDAERERFLALRARFDDLPRSRPATYTCEECSAEIREADRETHSQHHANRRHHQQIIQWIDAYRTEKRRRQEAEGHSVPDFHSTWLWEHTDGTHGVPPVPEYGASGGEDTSFLRTDGLLDDDDTPFRDNISSDDWDRMLALRDGRRTRATYARRQTALIKEYEKRCYPLDRGDLRSILDIHTAEVIGRYHGAPTLEGWRAGHKRVEILTFLWSCWEHRLQDEAKAQERRRGCDAGRKRRGTAIRVLPLVLDGMQDEQALPNEPTPIEPDLAAWIDAKERLRRLARTHAGRAAIAAAIRREQGLALSSAERQQLLRARGSHRAA